MRAGLEHSAGETGAAAPGDPHSTPLPFTLWELLDTAVGTAWGDDVGPEGRCHTWIAVPETDTISIDPLAPPTMVS